MGPRQHGKRPTRPGAAHVWVQKTKRYTRYDTSDFVEHGYECSECGQYQKMNYVLPEDTLWFLSVKACDEVKVKLVMES